MWLEFATPKWHLKSWPSEMLRWVKNTEIYVKLIKKKEAKKKKVEPNVFKKRQNIVITLLPRWNLYTIYERTFIALIWMAQNFNLY